MRDLNFFEPFIEKNQFKFSKIFLIYLALLIVTIGLILISTFNYIEITKLEKELKTLNQVAEDPETISIYEEIKAFEEETAQFKTEVEKIVALDKNIQLRDVVGEQLFKNINLKLPQGVFLTNMSVSGWQIQVSGFAEDKYTIAEFAKGITEISEVEDVFIANITEVESYYNYNLEIALTEVLADEE